MPKYSVLHPVMTHKLHPRGSIVELNAKDGATLHSQGHVTPLIVVEEDVVDLETLTKPNLIKYAFDNFDATLSEKLTKPELIEAIRFAIAEAAPKTEL